jgi:hypothetical protein
MSFRTFTVCVAALVLAVPAAAQQRGTMELGAFASAAHFNKDLSLKSGFGGGGRVGMYLDSLWSVEFENAEMRATRPNGLANVNVGILSGRLVTSIFRNQRPISLLVGLGLGVSTETNFMHSYGPDLLLGAKYALNDQAALRVDTVYDWLANENWKAYSSVRVGLTFYRHPNGPSRTAAARTPAATNAVMVRADSTSSRGVEKVATVTPPAAPDMIKQ